MASVRNGPLEVGDLAPWIVTQIHRGASDFNLNAMAGRHVLMLFVGSLSNHASRQAFQLALANARLFDDVRNIFFALTCDRRDIEQDAMRPSEGIHVMLDFEGDASRRFGAAISVDGVPTYRPHWLLLDPALRTIGRFDIHQGEQAIAALAAAQRRGVAAQHAPILEVPDVLDPDFCRHLVSLYQANGGGESGFMRTVGDKTVGTFDPKRKRRKDYVIEDENVQARLRRLLAARVVPMIARAFQFQITRIERYIVACYDAADGGHFGAHRDNTTRGTAHRRFAVTINLNDGFDGGELSFPEFGTRTYRCPPGGAIVFSCSLMHQAHQVTAGVRYATLPFLYDDAAATIRAANAGSIVSAKEEPTSVEA